MTRIEAIPPRYHALYRRALAGDLSPRQAIRCKCLECVAWHRFEGGDDRIGDCAVRGCPLWTVRPYQKALESRQTSEGSTSAVERDARTGGGPSRPPHGPPQALGATRPMKNETHAYSDPWERRPMRAPTP